MLILRERGGGSCIVFASFKRHLFRWPFHLLTAYLTVLFSSFQLDNMHSVQWIPNMWSYDIIAAIFVYFRCLDNLLIKIFKIAEHSWINDACTSGIELNWFQLKVNPSCLNLTEVQGCVMSKLLLLYGYIRVIYRIQLLTQVDRVHFI